MNFDVAYLTGLRRLYREIIFAGNVRIIGKPDVYIDVVREKIAGRNSFGEFFVEEISVRDSSVIRGEGVHSRSVVNNVYRQNSVRCNRVLGERERLAVLIGFRHFRAEYEAGVNTLLGCFVV